MMPHTPSASRAENYLRNALHEMLAFFGSVLPAVKVWRAQRATRYLDLAQVAYDANQLSEAIQLLSKAKEWSDAKSEVLAALGLVYAESGDSENAKRNYNLSILESFHLDGKSNFRALKGMATLYHEEGNLREALYYYLKALEQPGGDSDAAVLTNLGALFFDLGRFDESIEYSSRAEKIDANNPLVLQNLGRAAYAQGKLDKAVDYLKRATQVDPGNWDAIRPLALVHRARGEMKEAHATLEQAAKRAPKNPDILYDWALLLEEEGYHEQAVEAVAVAARYYGEQGNQEREASAYWQLGWSCYSLGDLKRSVAASRKAVELRPSLFAARFNLGLALLRLGDVDGARLEYETGLGTVQDPSDIQFYAIEDLQQVAEKYPDLSGVKPILEMLQRKYESLSVGLRSSGKPSAP